MITVKLTYSDNTIKVMQFKTKEELNWFVHNEGDHLIDVSIV